MARNIEEDPHYFSFVDNKLVSDITCTNLFRERPSLTYNLSKESEKDDGAIQGFEQLDVINYSIDVPKGDTYQSPCTTTSFGLRNPTKGN